MAEQGKYTILGRGEAYQEEITVPRGGGRRPQPRSLESSRQLLLPQLQDVTRAVAALPQAQRLDEVIVEVRLDEKFLAKSYTPESLFTNTGLKLRGTGTWKQTKSTATDGAVPDEMRSRALYVSGPEQALAKMGQVLSGTTIGQKLKEDLGRIEEIRLPTSSDRVTVPESPDPNQPIAVEFVLFPWESSQRTQAIDRLRTILRKHHVADDKVLVRTYDDGPTFVAAIVPHAVLEDVKDLNYLRVARLLPRVGITRTAVGVAMPAPPAPKNAKQPTSWVAVFDGGLASPNPHIDPFVQHKDLTSKAAQPALVEHGTAVCSAALFGPINTSAAELEPPTCGVLSFRVLPDSRDDHLELYGVIDAIEAEVPKLPADVKAVNISLGPNGPIDDAPSRFTYVIDKLSYEHDKLFFIAVGNWGHQAGADRIGAPADSVNNLGVGAFSYEPKTGEVSPTDYSCRGPGRGGAAIKPDFLTFGGSAATPFYVMDTKANMVIGTCGTSFASPYAAALGARLFARVQGGLDTQACRALLLHSAQKLPGEAIASGWGIVPETEEEILACSKQRVSVLYTGALTPRTSWKLPFLLPAGFDPGGQATFSWTIVQAPEVDPSATDEYTLAGIQPEFRPHKDVFRFTNPQDKTQSVILNVVSEVADVAIQESAGWTRSPLPVTDSARKKTEHTLRATEAKWDTVVRGQKTKRKEKFLEPMLTISMIGRGAWDQSSPQLQVRFAAILTVDVPKYKSDLYVDTMGAYALLKPLVLRPRTTVPVRVGV